MFNWKVCNKDNTNFMCMKYFKKPNKTNVASIASPKTKFHTINCNLLCRRQTLKDKTKLNFEKKKTYMQKGKLNFLHF